MSISVPKIYEVLCNTKSDINEHLPTLMKYSKECETILELGVRGVVSSWAFVYGLMNNEKSRKLLYCNDIQPCNMNFLEHTCKNIVDIKYKWCSDLLLDLPNDSFDMVFIDTFHVYGQLKRELEKFSKISKKYIIMHDTTVDKVHGEVKRYMMNQLNELIISTGFPKEELLTGLQPAIDEFIESHNNWFVKEVYTNNNGLTILERKDCV